MSSRFPLDDPVPPADPDAASCDAGERVGLVARMPPPAGSCTLSRKPGRRSSWLPGSAWTTRWSRHPACWCTGHGRDRGAIAELIAEVLQPLQQARGGAEPLIATLEGYFATGGVSVATAQRLHVSVRTVTYQLDRARALTGYAVTDPAHRFTLQAALLGAGCSTGHASRFRAPNP